MSAAGLIEEDARRLAAEDARLGLPEPIPLDVEVWGGGYAGLVRLILGQMVSIEAADAMWRNLGRTLGEVTPDSLRAADPATLRSCGFTARKAGYARAIADAIDGGFDFEALHRLEDAALVEELVALPGVGRWTAECYLLFCLGRRDVFPAGDLALRIGWQETAGLPETPSEAALREEAMGWAPRRTAAACLLWAMYLRRRNRV